MMQTCHTAGSLARVVKRGSSRVAVLLNTISTDDPLLESVLTNEAPHKTMMRNGTPHETNTYEVPQRLKLCSQTPDKAKDAQETVLFSKVFNFHEYLRKFLHELDMLHETMATSLAPHVRTKYFERNRDCEAQHETTALHEKV